MNQCFKKLAVCAIALCSAFAGETAFAQAYPNRNIRIIVPYPAGSTVDVDNAIRRMNPAIPEEAREAALRLRDRVRPMCQIVDRY